MRFGLFYLLERMEGGTSESVYASTMEQIRLADELGFDSVWLAEHRFTRYGVGPDVLLLAGAVAATTKRIRIGTAVVVLPFHNPVLVAEQVAMVDQLSGGRFMFGAGRGYQAIEFAGLGVPMEESRTRFEEALDICIGLWTQDNFSYRGQHYTVSNVTIEPKPVQKPHPPIWITAMRSPETFEYAANRGVGIISGNPYQSDPAFSEAFSLYRETLDRLGKPELSQSFWALSPTFVHDTHDGAVEIPMESGISYAEQFKRVGSPRHADGSLPRGYERYHDEFSGQRDTVLDYKGQVETEAYLHGTVDEVRRKIEFYAARGVNNFILWMNRGGGIPQREVLKSMELFARELMPQFKDVQASATTP